MLELPGAVPGVAGVAEDVAEERFEVEVREEVPHVVVEIGGDREAELRVEHGQPAAHVRGRAAAVAAHAAPAAQDQLRLVAARGLHPHGPEGERGLRGDLVELVALHAGDVEELVAAQGRVLMRVGGAQPVALSHHQVAAARRVPHRGHGAGARLVAPRLAAVGEIVEPLGRREQLPLHAMIAVDGVAHLDELGVVGVVDVVARVEVDEVRTRGAGEAGHDLRPEAGVGVGGLVVVGVPAVEVHQRRLHVVAEEIGPLPIARPVEAARRGIEGGRDEEVGGVRELVRPLLGERDRRRGRTHAAHAGQGELDVARRRPRPAGQVLAQQLVRLAQIHVHAAAPQRRKSHAVARVHRRERAADRAREPARLAGLQVQLGDVGASFRLVDEEHPFAVRGDHGIARLSPRLLEELLALVREVEPVEAALGAVRIDLVQPLSRENDGLAVRRERGHLVVARVVGETLHAPVVQVVEVEVGPRELHAGERDRLAVGRERGLHQLLESRHGLAQ